MTATNSNSQINLDVDGQTNLTYGGEVLKLNGTTPFTSLTFNNYPFPTLNASLTYVDVPGSTPNLQLVNHRNGWLYLGNNNSIDMTISPIGNVGIGDFVLPSTGTKLEVEGRTNIVKDGEALRLDGSNNWLSFYDGSSYNGYLNHNGTGFTLMNRQTGGLAFGTDNMIRMTIKDEGHVGIGTSNTGNAQLKILHDNVAGGGLNIENNFSTQKDWGLFVFAGGNFGLYANGAIRGLFDEASGEYSAVSDRRLKKNIENLEPVLDKVLLLEPTRYQFIDNNERNEENIGLIAQDVDKLFPEFVYQLEEGPDEGTYTMDYSGFGILAIKAIQEQQAIIESLQTKNQQISEEKAVLEERLSSLEEKFDGLLTHIAENK